MYIQTIRKIQTISIYSRGGTFPLIWSKNQEFCLQTFYLLPVQELPWRNNLNTNAGQGCNYRTLIFGGFVFPGLACYSFSLLLNMTSSTVLNCNELFCGNIFNIQERNAKYSLCCLHHFNPLSNLYSKLSLAICLAIIWNSQMQSNSCSQISIWSNLR